MAIDWKKHTIAISKRWGDGQSATAAASTTEEEPPTTTTSPDAPQQEPETGTRYFLHITFAIQFLLQVLNAGIQHLETPTFFAYIIMLHGPVLLFNVWVAQGFQEVMAKRYFQLGDVETKFDAVLSPLGGLTMHDTTTISQDVKVSLMIPLAYAMLTFFWLAWYAVFDLGDDFDETLTNGVDFEELQESIWGLFANVAAQALWLNVYLVALHLIVPVFPLSAASFFAAGLSEHGLGLRRTTMIMDFVGYTISFALFVFGIQQTLWDDKNGIGVFLFFNSLVLMILCFKRRYVDPLEDHDLVCRTCYIEKEDIPTTTTADGGEATDSNDVSYSSDGAAAAVDESTTEKELEIV